MRMILALLAALVVSPPALVLRSGQVIAISGNLESKGSQYVFRSGGRLYSLPHDEVDESATLKLARDIEADQLTAKDDGVARLRVSAEERDRLLAELAKSKGTPAPPAPVRMPAATAPAPVTPSVEAQPPDSRSEERYWRERSRDLQETVRQAHEDLEFLQRRAQNLQDEILGLLSLGYRPNQFSLQVFKLDRTRDAIEETKLDVTRAERALQQFREDARREGILPGWLR